MSCPDEGGIETPYYYKETKEDMNNNNPAPPLLTPGNINTNQTISSELPYYQKDKKSNKNIKLDGPETKVLLCFNIITFLIVFGFLIADIILASEYDFVNQIYAYIDRIILIIITLGLLITYKYYSKTIWIIKIIVLIVNIIMGLVLRILQFKKIKNIQPDDISIIFFRLMISFIEIGLYIVPIILIFQFMIKK